MYSSKINLNIRPSQNDEMCNVNAMYSYELPKTSDREQNGTLYLTQQCWDNQVSEIIK